MSVVFQIKCLLGVFHVVVVPADNNHYPLVQNFETTWLISSSNSRSCPLCGTPSPIQLGTTLARITDWIITYAPWLGIKEGETSVLLSLWVACSLQ